MDWREPFRHGEIIYDEPDGLVIHGDCRDLLRHMPRESADCIIFDPPWEYDRKQVERICPGRQYIQMSDRDIRCCWIHLMLLLKRDRHMYLWTTAPKLFEQWILTGKVTASRLIYKGILVWDKRPFFGMGNYFRNQAEFALLFAKGNFVGYSTTIGNIVTANNEGHSHKPFAATRAMLELSTREGDAVLDPCANSGNILIAAKALKRRFVGMEIDEQLCREAADRLRQKSLF